MGIKTINTQIQLRYDTESNWTKTDPVLLAGEIAISSDKNNHKVGNGSLKWSALNYIVPDSLPSKGGDADSLGGIPAQRFLLSNDVGELSPVVGVKDADTLGGFSPSHFAVKSDLDLLYSKKSDVEKINSLLTTKIETNSGNITKLQNTVNTDLANIRTDVSNINTNVVTKLNDVEKRITAAENKFVDKSTLSTVAKTGSYNDLLNTPIKNNKLTGVVSATPNNNYLTPQLRNVIISMDDPNPAVGEDGDIWIKYELEV